MNKKYWKIDKKVLMDSIAATLFVLIGIFLITLGFKLECVWFGYYGYVKLLELVACILLSIGTVSIFLIGIWFGYETKNSRR